MKSEEAIGWTKVIIYAVIGILIISIVLKVFKKLSSLFKSKSEEASELADELSEGMDYLQPNDWKQMLPKGKKPSELVDFKKTTNTAIDWYLSNKYEDPKLFLIALKRLNSKFEVAIASWILFDKYKITASFVSQNLKVYPKAKEIILSLPKF